MARNGASFFRRADLSEEGAAEAREDRFHLSVSMAECGPAGVPDPG